MQANLDLKFELYRYQLNPVKTRQLKLFGEQISYEELRSRKNEIFKDIILENPPRRIIGKGYYFQRSYYNEGEMYMFKFASQKHITHHTKELKDEILEDYPFVYLMVNNNPKSQTIAISRNYKAFNSTETVANILESHYGAILLKSDLTFSLMPILDKHEYWGVLEKYQGRITQIRFDLIKPNITNLSKALKEGVKELTKSTNTHRTRIELNSSTNQTLEDVNQNNEQVVALSEYSLEGGGEVSLKAKGVKGRIKTSKSIRTYEIQGLQIEGSPEAVANTMKKITE